MCRNGTVVMSEDNTVIKFITPLNSHISSASINNSDSVGGRIWNVVQCLTASTTTATNHPISSSSSCSYSSDCDRNIITISDTWHLQLTRSIATLSTRVQALEKQMVQYRAQALRYKVTIIIIIIQY
jgi:hypothetical protein